MKKFIKQYNRIALTVGIFIGVLHLIWAILVVLGIGQTILDWIFPLHFISNMYTVIGFSFLGALMLVILSFIGGYVSTLLFIAIWNTVRGK